MISVILNKTGRPFILRSTGTVAMENILKSLLSYCQISSFNRWPVRKQRKLIRNCPCKRFELRETAAKKKEEQKKRMHGADVVI